MATENSTDRDFFAIEFGQRIKSLRLEMGLNQTEFGEKIGVSPNFLSEIERGKKVPGAQTVASLSRMSGKSADWILTGEELATHHFSEVAAVAVPLFLTPVSAGQPTPPGEEPPEYFHLPEDLLPNPRVFMVKVAGDSMIGAGIRYGDILIVDPEELPVRGEIVVAVLEGETTVKRLEIVQDGKGRKVFLYPENERYEPIEITHREAAIQGVVKGLLRAFEGASWRDKRAKPPSYL